MSIFKRSSKKTISTSVSKEQLIKNIGDVFAKKQGQEQKQQKTIKIYDENQII